MVFNKTIVTESNRNAKGWCLKECCGGKREESICGPKEEKDAWSDGVVVNIGNLKEMS